MRQIGTSHDVSSLSHMVVAPRLKRSVDRLITIALISTVSLTVLPFFGADSIYDRGAVGELARKVQIGLPFGFFVVWLLFIIRDRASAFSTKQTGVVFLCALWMAMSGGISDFVGERIGYSALFLLVAGSLTLGDGASSIVANRLRILGGVLTTILVTFVLTKSQEGRWIGGVHPNVTGTLLIGAVVWASVWGALFRRLVGLFAIGVAVAVSSRYSALAIFIFMAFTEFLAGDVFRRLALVMIIFIFGVGLSEELITFVDRGDDMLERSFSQGLAGRDRQYSQLIQMVWSDVPTLLFGQGFRWQTITGSSFHSGAMVMIMELGLVGFALIGGIVWFRVRALIGMMSSGEAELRLVAGTFLGMLALYVVPLATQPNYINFFDPLGLSFIIAVFMKLGPERSVTSDSCRVGP